MPKFDELRLRKFDQQFSEAYASLSDFLSVPANIEMAGQFSIIADMLNNKSFADVKIGKEFSRWLGDLMSLHPAFKKPDIFLQGKEIAVYQAGENSEEAVGFNKNAACILTVGSLSLGLAGQDLKALALPLFLTAVGCDLISIVIRTLLLEPEKKINPETPRLDITLPFERLLEMEDCRVGLTQAMAGVGASALGITGQNTVPVTNADGIASIAAYAANCREQIQLSGSFPYPQPPGVDVIVPSVDGAYYAVTIDSWTSTLIQVSPAFTVGEGPVGFQIGTVTLGYDFSNAMAFGDMLGACFGTPGRNIGVIVTSMATANLALPNPPPVLANKVNVILGGQLCIRLNLAVINEDSEMIVTGKRFKPGDQVFVDNKACATIFINDGELRTTVAGIGITGGQKSVYVRRNTCDSNLLPVFFASTLVNNQSIRCTPFDLVNISGFGFQPGLMMARINGELARVICSSATALSLWTFKPVYNAAILSQNKDIEVCSIEIFQGSTLIGTIPLNFDVFRVAFFGDSVMWGQGLAEHQKFSELLGTVIGTNGLPENVLTSIYKTIIKVDRAAHSGATVMEDLNDRDILPFQVSPCIFDTDAMPAWGEVPRSQPSITSQLNAWTSKSERQGVDLVVLNGGINDVNIRSIFSPAVSDADLVSKTNTACNFAFQGILFQALSVFPQARIIATGYYAIVAPASDMAQFLEIAIPALFLSVFTPPIIALGHSWLTHRSQLFRDTAHAAMQQAIDTVDPQRLRVRFADPDFQPQNAIFASNTFIFGAEEDPMYKARGALCIPGGGSSFCPAASIGHPNAPGAQAYANAITDVLKKW